MQAITLLACLLVPGVAAIALKCRFSIITPQHTATLIHSLELYLPSLHRNPACSEQNIRANSGAGEQPIWSGLHRRTLQTR
ncbi:MAG: hypothetical protein ABIP20_08565 [Chthoniobacteraceae bacterium]